MPNVKDIEIRIIPEAATRWAALKKGEIDIADLTGTPFIAEAKKNNTLKLARGRNGSFIDLHPMIANIRSKDFVNEADKPFLNAKVRRAMSMALDRKTIVDIFFYGFGTPAKYRLAPYSRGYRANDSEVPYDPAAARKLLAEAGYME